MPVNVIGCGFQEKFTNLKICMRGVVAAISKISISCEKSSARLAGWSIERTPYWWGFAGALCNAVLNELTQ